MVVVLSVRFPSTTEFPRASISPPQDCNLGVRWRVDRIWLVRLLPWLIPGIVSYRKAYVYQFIQVLQPSLTLQASSLRAKRTKAQSPAAGTPLCPFPTNSHFRATRHYPPSLMVIHLPVHVKILNAHVERCLHPLLTARALIHSRDVNANN